MGWPHSQDGRTSPAEESVARNAREMWAIYMLEGKQYPDGFLHVLMDAPSHASIEELLELANYKEYWNIYVNALQYEEGIDEHW